MRRKQAALAKISAAASTSKLERLTLQPSPFDCKRKFVTQGNSQVTVAIAEIHAR